MTEDELFRLERPEPVLWKLYLLRSFGTLPVLPVFPLVLLLHWFRYRTLRYRFDAEGIHCSWGVWIRQEVNVAYSRIQDIHLTSGILQRWLGLADVQVQTASGNAGAELVIEGFRNAAEIRNLLYRRMRGARVEAPAPVTSAVLAGVASTDLASVLARVCDELRATREAIEKLRPPVS